MGLLSAAFGQTARTRAELYSQITSTLASGQMITAAQLRTVLQDVVASAHVFGTDGPAVVTDGMYIDPAWLVLSGDASKENALGNPAGNGYVLSSTTGGTRSWIALSGGGDALTTNPLSQFAATTSAQLAGVISDETGSGALVFATSPTFTTPTLGAATATSINGVTITGGSTPALTVTGTTAVSGTNTGDQTITLTGDATGSGTGSFATTLATVNSNVGTFGSATAVPTVTVNGKGLVTAASNTTIAIPATAISDSTAAGRTLLTAADAAAQKTALSLGSVENVAINSWGGSTNIVTLGTVSTGTWSGTAVAVNKGGTGQTSYTNGQLLIGNTTSGGLDKTTLTGGTGITITNGAGSITINSTASGGAEKWDATFDGQGQVISANVTVYRAVTTTGNITAGVLIADASGNATISINRHTPSGGALGSATPLGNLTLSSAVHSRDTTLTGWTKAVTAGDVLAIKTESATAATRLTVNLTQ